MSMFLCDHCQHMADSDDGCTEYLGHLICEECAEDLSMDIEINCPDDDGETF